MTSCEVPGENWSQLKLTWDQIMDTVPIDEVISWIKQAPGGSYCIDLNEDYISIHFENLKDLRMFLWRWA